jgi:hypothetical protein
MTIGQRREYGVAVSESDSLKIAHNLIDTCESFILFSEVKDGDGTRVDVAVHGATNESLREWKRKIVRMLYDFAP